MTGQPASETTFLRTTPLDVATLTQVLGLLGRSVNGADDAAPEVTVVHLTRLLVAAAEQQAISAELALARAGDGVLPDGADVSGHQGTYDLATTKGSLALLAVCHWRGQRFSAGVQAVAEALCAADRAADDDATGAAVSPLVRMWDLAVPAAVAAQALFGFLASVTIDDADTGAVAALDAATALLVSTGEQARRLRAEIGLGGADDPASR